MECSANQRVGAQIPEDDDQEDPFKRLPDELIISHILDKIFESKSLFISLVSHHFSSLVFQAHDVYLKIPLQNLDHVGVDTDYFDQPTVTTYHPFLPGKFVRFVAAPMRLVHWLLRSILQRSSRPLPLPLPPSTGSNSEFLSQIPIKFLTKFTSMRSLYLEYDNSGPGLITSKEPLVRWTVHPKASAYVLVYGWNFLDLDHDGQDFESFVANEGESVALHFNYHMKIASSVFTLLEKLVPSLSKSLKKLVVTDTKKQSKVDLGEDDVAELRNLNVDFENFKASVRIWFVPLLVLPLSGCVFKMVTQCMYKDSESDYDDFLVAKEAFDGEDETVYAEAATEMVKKEVVYEKIL